MKSILKLVAASTVGLCLCALPGAAQDASNFPGLVLDVSRTDNGGSARVLGIGGAQTAIGGDISSVSSNPAGLGFFNRSEFSFSMQFNGVGTTSTYLNTSTDDSKLNFNIPNLGAVIKTGRNSGKWKGQAFGVSLNRTANFQRSLTYEGNTTDELIPADFLEFATFDTELSGSNPVFLSDFAELAFDIGVIDIFEDDQGQLFVDRNIYDSETGEPALPTQELPTLQRETIDVRGANSQFSLSYGANYDDRVYLGAGIGITSFNRDVERTFTENPTRTDLSQLTLLDDFEQTGIGINATLGLIIRPVDMALIGLTYTTPTYYTVSQIQEIELSAAFTDGEFFSRGFLYDEFDYSIRTPSRIKGGITGFLDKSGFITGEVEFVDYGGGNLSRASDGISFTEDNLLIDRYNQVINFRIGGEYRYEIFRLRAGFAYLQDPVENDLEQDERQISFGAGIRKKNYYIDLAVVNSDGFQSRVSPYPGAPVAGVENNDTRVTFTVGLTF